MYGYRRVHAELTLGHGLAFAEEAVWLTFYNRQRRHSALGMLTPVEFEMAHQPVTAA